MEILLCTQFEQDNGMNLKWIFKILQHLKVEHGKDKYGLESFEFNVELTGIR